MTLFRLGKMCIMFIVTITNFLLSITVKRIKIDQYLVSGEDMNESLELARGFWAHHVQQYG